MECGRAEKNFHDGAHRGHELYNRISDFHSPSKTTIVLQWAGGGKNRENTLEETQMTRRFHICRRYGRKRYAIYYAQELYIKRT